MLKRILQWLEQPPDNPDGRPPIQTGDAIDVVAVREDGGVDLVIVVHGHLDDSQSTQRLLENKIRNYLRQRHSAAFAVEFRFAPADRVAIVIETDEPPARGIRSLLHGLEPEVQAQQTRLLVRGHQHRQHSLRQLFFPVLQGGPGPGHAGPRSGAPGQAD